MTMVQQRMMVNLRDYFERLLTERDHRYAERFRAQEQAVQKALDAQRDYNSGHNDLIHKMDEQAKTFIPRAEFNVQHDSLLQRVDGLETQIQTLREAQSRSVGSSLATREFFSYGIATLAVLAAILSHFL